MPEREDVLQQLDVEEALLVPVRRAGHGARGVAGKVGLVVGDVPRREVVPVLPHVDAVRADVDLVVVGLFKVHELQLLGQLLGELALADAVGALHHDKLAVLVESEGGNRWI